MLDRLALKDFVKANPEMPCADVADLFECQKQHVYHARHNVGVSKPVTMTKKKRLKVVRKSTLEDKDARIAELEKQVEMLKINPNEKTNHVDKKFAVGLINQARKFETELLDAKAIIAYLEGKLDGASV